MTALDEKIDEQGAGRIDTEYEQVDEINGDVNVQITENDTRNEEERQMIRHNGNMRSGQVSSNAGFKRFDRNRALVAQLIEHRVVTREVVSSTPAGPTLRVLK